MNVLELTWMVSVVLVPISTALAIRILMRASPGSTIGEAARGLAIARFPRLWHKAPVDPDKSSDAVGLSVVDTPELDHGDQAATG